MPRRQKSRMWTLRSWIPERPLVVCAMAWSDGSRSGRQTKPPPIWHRALSPTLSNSMANRSLLPGPVRSCSASGSFRRYDRSAKSKGVQLFEMTNGKSRTLPANQTDWEIALHVPLEEDGVGRDVTIYRSRHAPETTTLLECPKLPTDLSAMEKEASVSYRRSGGIDTSSNLEARKEC